MCDAEFQAFYTACSELHRYFILACIYETLRSVSFDGQTWPLEKMFFVFVKLNRVVIDLWLYQYKLIVKF